MSKTYRVGVLGLTHDHVWSNLEELKASTRGQLMAVADPHKPLLERAGAEYGVPTYDNAMALLDRESIDAVYIYGDNAGGVELTELAAARGLAIMVEKPLAHSLAGADRMLAAARRAGVRLMVNWPFAWRPELQHALRMADDGQLGDVWQVRYRAAHAGPRELGCSTYFCDWLYNAELNGAGALIDYCCYGAVLARAVMGLPHRVTAVAGRLQKEAITMEDNAMLLMSYPRGMAVAEASWTQIGKLTAYQTVFHGTTGTLVVERHPEGSLLLATTDEPDGRSIEVPRASDSLTNASEHFFQCLDSGQAFMPLCQDRICRDAQEILQAGLVSARQGAEIALPLKLELGPRA